MHTAVEYRVLHVYTMLSFEPHTFLLFEADTQRTRLFPGGPHTVKLKALAVKRGISAVIPCVALYSVEAATSPKRTQSLQREQSETGSTGSTGSTKATARQIKQNHMVAALVRLQLLAAQLANRGRRDRQAGKELWGQKTNRGRLDARCSRSRAPGCTTGHVLMVNALLRTLIHVSTRYRRTRRESADCNSREHLGRGLG